MRRHAGDTHRRATPGGEALNLANPVGRLRADAEVSGGSWRSPVESYPEGRAKGLPHAGDLLLGVDPTVVSLRG